MHRPDRARTRRMSAWAGFLLVVVALRMAGIGAAPAEVGAAPAEEARAVDPAATLATRAFTWLLSDFDVSALAPATERCLEAGAGCAPEDLLELDTTRVRLASLVNVLDDATDPAAAGYLGQPDRWIAERVVETRAAAAAAADALDHFLSAGCAGTVDGVVVTALPQGCDPAVEVARRALASAASVLGEWP